ncbi:MAG: hypothetical protein R3F49_17840 [Planctomycetota bacterium]
MQRPALLATLPPLLASLLASALSFGPLRAPSSSAEGSQAAASAPGYRAVAVRGFDVRLQDVLDDQLPELRDRVLEVLDRKLGDIAAVIPGPALERLRAVTLWVSEGAGPAPCANYHPSEAWLRANGFEPRKAKGVELCNASVFVDWVHSQPSMILHELAHAYHDQVLSYGNKELLRAHLVADASGRFNAVRRMLGNVERHYALNNAQEWFAEATEALFGTNDYFPFVRGELVHADPEGARLVARLWGAEEPRGLRDAESAPERARSAVVALHAFFNDWCVGRVPNTDPTYARFTDALAPDFQLVAPTGEELDRATIIAQLRTVHGSGAIEIALDEVASRYVADGLWLVSYHEWQRKPDAPWRGRTSAALLREDPSAAGGFRWLHVHETWLPEAAQTGPRAR